MSSVLRHRSVACSFLALVLAIPLGARAQTGSPGGSGAPVMHAARRDGPVVIDGQLNEAAWAQAPVASHFTQSYPDPGAVPQDSTTVRVLYDDQAIYFGVRLFDARPDSIAAQLARRDAGGIYSDWAHVIIDSYHDRRTAFRFSANPRGVEKDVYSSNDRDEDVNWDAVWQVATRIDSLGWVAEYRIPLSQLRFGRQPADSSRIWGIQVMRDIARRNERDSWAPWTPQSPGFVSQFGELVGLVDVPEPKRLEVLPYVSSMVTRAPVSAGDPFYRANDTEESVGADVRVGLPAGLTLTATVNPDFGQVEVDPAVVNLSAYETFFPEKRPFFLEGADIFDFGAVRRNNDFGAQYFFYSRRIGRAPQLRPSGSDVLFVDAPNQTTIAGAAKVTGKAGPWSVGLLNAMTTEEEARVATASGTRRVAPVEPATNYFAGRVKRDFRGGASFIGAMLMSTNRSMSDSVFTLGMRGNATFGGVDFEHGVRNRSWILSGFLAGSRVSGSAQAIAATERSSTHYYQRPDATHLSYDPTRTSLDGYMGEVALMRSGSVFGSVAYKTMSPGFEINDLGYVGRGDYHALSTLVGYQSFRATSHLRSYNGFAYANSAWNHSGNSILQQVAASAFATFANLWSASAGGSRSWAVDDDRLLRGGPMARSPAGWSADASVTTDSRWPVIVGLNGRYGGDASGSRTRGFGLSFDMRPTTTLHVTVGPDLNLSDRTAQYVTAVPDGTATQTFGARYLFAELSQRTLSMDMRVEWTLTPHLSFQTFVQPFVSAGAYTSLKEFTRPGTFDFAVYGEDRGTLTRDGATRVYTIDPDAAGPARPFQVYDPDFNVRSLRGNAVLRWEYQPGSTIYLVWQQERSGYEPTGDFVLDRDIRGIFDTRATNIFLVKATYWIGH